jgi:hypothetical protein
VARKELAALVAVSRPQRPAILHKPVILAHKGLPLAPVARRPLQARAQVD